MLKDMTAQGAQFIIATHSPIVLAAPCAVILSLDGETVMPTAYDGVANVVLIRAFLANPEAYPRRLSWDIVTRLLSVQLGRDDRAASPIRTAVSS